MVTVSALAIPFYIQAGEAKAKSAIKALIKQPVIVLTFSQEETTIVKIVLVTSFLTLNMFRTFFFTSLLLSLAS